jgi:hypothetical protein
VIDCITINLFCQAPSITFNLFPVPADNLFMAKEQISVRLDSVTLRQIDGFAASEKRTRNNMIEILVGEALITRLLEHANRVGDSSLKGEALNEEVKRVNELDRNMRGPPKKSGK